RVISTPLLHLREVAATVTGEHRYDIRAAYAGGDEIGHLVRGFNEMLEEIQRRDRTLLDHQQRLEDLVNDRTAELRSANADLVAARDKTIEASRAESQIITRMR